MWIHNLAALSTQSRQPCIVYNRRDYYVCGQTTLAVEISKLIDM